MGLENPVGTMFQLYDNKGQIVGVVEDFHYKSLQTAIEPLVLRIEPRRDSYVFVKFRSEQGQEALASIRRVHDSFNPEFPLEYSFLDESVSRLYDSEQKTKNIFNYFTFIAIFISCLGLYGLAAHMAQQKTKEIGIRKVLGASVMNIMTGLSREFVILVCLANTIAWPAAYYVMNRWLEHFASRTGLSVWIFILSGLASLFIAVLTIFYQSIKAATANPVKSLRYE